MRLAIFGGTPVRLKPFGQWPVFDEREEAALLEVLKSGVWGGYNKKVTEFEEAFARFHQTSFGITAANGTVTLEAALTAAGIGPGDEVIVPPISFISTASAVVRVGAVPVFSDIDEATYNLDPSRLSEAITPRTRALIPVHFAGHPADMDAILRIADKNDLVVIEDAAHAHGASWRGQKVGSFGDLGSFSFQQSKVMTSGEGGILTTNDAALAENVRSFGNHGRRSGRGWFEHVSLGTNCRLTAWQAAILGVQLSRLPEQLEKRASNARCLTKQLEELAGISTPKVDERVTCHSYYLYMIRIEVNRFPGVSKEKFVKALAAEGIPCATGYPYPLYRNPLFESYEHKVKDCPVTERMCAESFWVSHEITLAPEDDLKDFVAALEKVTEAAEELADVPVPS
jgi:dTDP-4-amino-4,6-dideoxygalactose transaminase